MHPYLTSCVNVWSSTYRTNLKIACTAQKRSVRALFATAQQPHSRDIFLNQKILPLDKLINNQEGILAYKVINETYLLGDILTDRHELHRYHLLSICVLYSNVTYIYRASTGYVNIFIVVMCTF